MNMERILRIKEKMSKNKNKKKGIKPVRSQAQHI